MTDLLFLDLETSSECNLPKQGLARYAAHPTTRIDALCWALNYGDVVKHKITRESDMGAQVRLGALLADRPDMVIVAHNAVFERTMLHRLGEAGSDLVRRAQWLDTMHLAQWLALPPALDKLASWLIGERKHAEGYQVMRRGVGPLLPHDHDLLADYCAQDVVLMRKCFHEMSAMMEKEEKNLFLRQSRADIAINELGIPVDQDLIKQCVHRVAELRDQADREVSELTSGAVPKASSRARLVAWLISTPEGGSIPKPAKNGVREVTQALAASKLPADVVKRLSWAVGVAGSQSLSKWAAAGERAVNGRVYYCYAFGAQTHGRWSSYGVQMHNLPRSTETLTPDSVDDATAASLKTGMRSMVRARPWHKLIISDYSQIEFRILCWLIGAETMLARLRTGLDPYRITAADMYAVDYPDVTPAQRQTAKSAVLGLGYGMGVEKFAAYSGMSVADSSKVCSAYHVTLPGVKTLHQRLSQFAHEAAKRAIPETPIAYGLRKDAGLVAGYCTITDKQRELGFRLPSGRIIRLWGVRQSRDGLVAQSHGKPVKLWGGTLCEFIICGIARDLLARALVRAKDGYLHPVGHTHDEVILEVPVEQMPYLGDAAKTLDGVMLDGGDNDPYIDLPLATETRVANTWSEK